MSFFPDKLKWLRPWKRSEGRKRRAAEKGSSAATGMLDANSPGLACRSLAGAHPLETGRPSSLVMVRALKG